MFDPTPQNLAQHIDDLARAFNIEIRYDPSRPPWLAEARQFRATLTSFAGLALPGPVEKFVVTCSPVVDLATYAVALHELGHGCSGLFTPSDMLNAPTCEALGQLKLHEEEAAWTWAHRYAGMWTDRMTDVERFSLDSYRELVTIARRVDDEVKLAGVSFKNVRELLAEARRYLDRPVTS